MSLPLSLDPSFSGSLDKFKESFLCAAAQGGNTEDCESLLEIGANVEWRNADGDTPLLSAVRRGHAETAALLLVHGADLNARGHDGLTPLHVVCRNGDVRTMNVLLNAGASPQVVSDSNQTPVDIARSKGYVDIVKRLTSSVDASGGSTPGASSSLGGSGTLPPVVPQRYDSDMDSARAMTPQLLGRTSGNSGSSHGAVAINNTNGSMNSAIQSSQQVLRGSTGAGSSNSRGITPTAHPNPTLSERGSTGSRSGSRAGGSGSNPRMISSVSISGDDGSIQVSSSLTSLPTSTDNSNGARSNLTQTPKRSAAYALIGGGRAVAGGAMSDSDSLRQQQTSQTASADFMNDDQYIGLCRQLEVEIKARKLLESQLLVARRQALELEEALVASKQEVSELEAGLAAQRAELDRYRAAGVESYTMSECDDLERRLKATLDAVSKRKDQIIQEELGTKKEQRLCVVCLAKEKSVVLFPCRHMCVCDECAAHDDLDTCPLCRRVIVQRVSVFS